MNINILILNLTTLFVAGFAQTNKTNQPMMIPLTAGENAPVLFETLLIEPVNLFIQSKPWDDSSPHVQLELNVTQGEREYATFLWYYKTGNTPPTNFPKAFEEYLFGLEINDNNILLTIDRLDFGKEFYIDCGQKAVIGELSVSFDAWMGERIALPNGGSADLNVRYKIMASNNNKQEELSFDSLSWLKKDELVLEWKEYQIFVTGDFQDYLKLKVEKQ
jgi:hypothetical protein